MAEPITWRNITGPNPADALRPMQAAQESFTNSLGSLEKMLLNAQQQATNVENRGLDESKQKYLSYLDGITNPEDLLARRAEAQKMFASLDPRVQAQVRDADEQRFKALTEFRTQELGVADDNRKRKEEPIRDNVLTLAYGGNYDGAMQLLGQNADIRDRASLMKAIEDSKRTGKEFQWKEETHRDQRASSALGRKEAGLRIDTLQRQKEDDLTARALADEMARRAADHRNKQRIVSEQYAVLAKELNYPEFVRPDGRLDMEQIEKYTDPNSKAYDTDEGKTKRARVEALKTQAQQRGLLPYASLTTSDTMAADQAYNELVASGKYRPADLEKAREQFRSGFDGGSTPLVGREKAKSDRIAAETQVDLERDIAEGWSLPGSLRAREMGPRLTADLMDKINTADGSSPEQDLPGIRNAIGRVINEGILVDNQRVVPSESLILQALNSAEGSWWADGNGSWINGRDSAFIAKLTDLANTPEMRAQAKKAQANDLADREARIRAAQRNNK